MDEFKNFVTKNDEASRKISQEIKKIPKKLTQIVVQDTRNLPENIDKSPSYAPKPNDAVLNNKVIALFHFLKNSSDWASSLIIKGWNSTYRSWMLSSNAGASDYESLFISFSDNVKNEWRDPIQIWHEKNLTRLSQLNDDTSQHIKNWASTNFVPILGVVTKKGTLTFEESPVVPQPTLSVHAANKKYVDDIFIKSPIRALSSQKNSVISADTRSVNDRPQDLKSGIMFDFKRCDVIGLSSGTTYASVYTFCSYSDSSGNSNVAYRHAHSNNKLFFQKAISDTEWGAWQLLSTEKDLKDLGLGLSMSDPNLLPPNNDCNDALVGGAQYQTTYKTLSLPKLVNVGGGTLLVFKGGTASGFITQMWIHGAGVDSLARTFIRTRDNRPSWSIWSEHVTKDNLHLVDVASGEEIRELHFRIDTILEGATEVAKVDRIFADNIMDLMGTDGKDSKENPENFYVPNLPAGTIQNYPIPPENLTGANIYRLLNRYGENKILVADEVINRAHGWDPSRERFQGTSFYFTEGTPFNSTAGLKVVVQNQYDEVVFYMERTSDTSETIHINRLAEPAYRTASKGKWFTFRMYYTRPKTTLKSLKQVEELNVDSRYFLGYKLSDVILTKEQQEKIKE